MLPSLSKACFGVRKREPGGSNDKLPGKKSPKRSTTAWDWGAVHQTEMYLVS